MSSATQRATFEGRRTTIRTAAMLKEARRIYTARTKRAAPQISQGGYNGGGVAASAGTHDRDAMDFRTAGLPGSLQRIWEESLWAVGFAAWYRPYVFNLWPEHCHAIPKGGDLSQGARYQVSAFRAQRNGLRSNLRYPRIGKYAYRTWEGYLASRPKPKPVLKPLPKVSIGGKMYADVRYVALTRIRQARVLKARSVHVWWCQMWLNRLGFYKAARDGRWGPVTQKAWDAFCRSEKIRGNGPDWTSLRALARAAKTNKPISSGK